MLAQVDDKVLGMVVSKVEEAVTSRLARTEKAPEGPYLLKQADGSVRVVDAYVPPPTFRAYRAESLRGLVEALRDLPHTPAGDGGSTRPAVLVSLAGAVAYFDETTRREAIVMPFPRSEAHGVVRRHFKVRSATEGMRNPEPQDLVWTLRADFAGQVLPETVMATVRTMKFSRRNASASSVAASRESFGSEIEMEVDCPGGDLPETIQVRYPVLDIAGDDGAVALARVTCDTRLEFRTGRIQVKPRASSVLAAEREAVEQIAAWLSAALKGTGIAVVCGVLDTERNDDIGDEDDEDDATA